MAKILVFKLKQRQTGKLLALKCFTRFQERREESYRLISAELGKQNSPYLLRYDYLEKEVWITDYSGDGAEYAAVAMEWADGMTLGDYVKTSTRGQIPNQYEEAFAFMLEKGKELHLTPVL